MTKVRGGLVKAARWAYQFGRDAWTLAREYGPLIVVYLKLMGKARGGG